MTPSASTPAVDQHRTEFVSPDESDLRAGRQLRHLNTEPHGSTSNK
ncbi:hypothetical protein [Nocardia sp. NPDC005366]